MLSSTAAGRDDEQAMEDAEVVPVLVVDDQAPFRLAARNVIRMTKGFELVGEAGTGEEAVESIEAVRPALVLMDINMPGINGIEATRQIVAAHPEVVVFLCSTYQLADLPPDAETSGARAYVNKEALAPSVLRRLWDERANPLDGLATA
jgi:two-component system invasion response regulator UvrY